MNTRDHKIYLHDKQNLDARLARKQYADRLDPMFKESNLHYEIAERTRAIGFGGIGAMHKLVCKLRLDEAINIGILPSLDKAEEIRSPGGILKAQSARLLATSICCRSISFILGHSAGYWKYVH